MLGLNSLFQQSSVGLGNRDRTLLFIQFTETHPIAHILGCHVEMSIHPRIDYLIRTHYQPYERPPQMTVAQLKALESAIAAVNGRPGIHLFDDFILYNGVPDRYFSYEAMHPEAEPGAVG